ncbi:hypothetical protein BSKO_12674 [Bryopsis sp. KO-2023]|nr:hypothetical protein BSKO_12674 [Bryopsis sp. KO-2023]
MFRSLLITGVTLLAVSGVKRLAQFLGDRHTIREQNGQQPRLYIAWQPPRESLNAAERISFKHLFSTLTDLCFHFPTGTAQIRNEFEVRNHKGDVPIAETSIRDDPAVVVIHIEDPKEVEAAVTEAIGDTLNETRQDGSPIPPNLGKLSPSLLPVLALPFRDRIPSSGSPDAEGEAANQTEAENPAATKSIAVGEQIDIGAEPADASIRGEVENVGDGWEQEAVLRTPPTKPSDSSAPPRTGGTGVEEAKRAVSRKQELLLLCCYGVYPLMDACCKKGGAFRNGCRPPPEKTMLWKSMGMCAGKIKPSVYSGPTYGVQWKNAAAQGMDSGKG